MSLSKKFRTNHISAFSSGIPQESSNPKRIYNRPFTNISEIPFNEVFPSSYSKDFQETESNERSSDIRDKNFSLESNKKKVSVDQEEILNLHEYINLLKRKLQNQGISFPILKVKKRKTEEKNYGALENENAKLKKALKSTEENVERLYQEIRILSEQLLIYQKRIEDFSENRVEESELTQSEKMIKICEQEANAIFSEMSSKLVQNERKIEDLYSQLFLLKKSRNSVNPKNSNKSKSFQEEFGAQNVINLQKKVEEYESEIFRLGIILLKQQEKYEKFGFDSQENISKLLCENLALKESIENSPRKAKKDLIFPIVPFHKGLKPSKLDEKNKIIEDYKGQIECIHESYNEQLVKLFNELQITQKSYSELEILLEKSQEKCKNYDEILLLNEALEVKAQKVEILSEVNAKLNSEIVSNNKSEIARHYSRLLIELKTNEEIIEKLQLESESNLKKIDFLEDTISSLKSGFYPFNSQSALLTVDTSLPEELLKKNEIISELRSQMITLATDYEKSLQVHRQSEEIYTSCALEVHSLKAALASLEFEISTLRP